MTRKKDKSLAAMLAFFGGIVGLHRFYLGQTKLGILMILLTIFTLGIISSLIGLIDSIILFTMDPDVFDLKYNKKFEQKLKTYAKRRRRITQEYPDYTRRTQHQHHRSRKIRIEKKVNEKPPSNKENSTRKSTKEWLKKVNFYKTKGIESFKEYDFEESIQYFKKVLEIDASNIAAHFNIACAYSQIEQKELAIRHIDLAVMNGFNDFDKIKKHDKLSYVRIQNEWEEFEKNGFRLPKKEVDPISTTVIEEEKILESTSEPEMNISESLFENLKKLKEQRERGIISDIEFELERKKLLS